MSSAPIYFQFQDAKSARLAYDTLKELEYHVHPVEQDQTLLEIVIDHNDLTSAIEIAQAHGGSFKETKDTFREHNLVNVGYDLGSIPIPAHVVNEDWSESYANGRDAAEGSQEEEGLDPDDHSYNHFSAGVHL